MVMSLQVELATKQWRSSESARSQKLIQLRADLAALGEQQKRDAQRLSSCKDTYAQLQAEFTAKTT
jgi:septation ring formation regulator EzrA